MENYPVTKWTLAAIVGAFVYAVVTGAPMSATNVSLLLLIAFIALTIDIVRIKSAPNISKMKVSQFNAIPAVWGIVGVEIYNPTKSNITDIEIELKKISAKAFDKEIADFRMPNAFYSGINCRFNKWADNGNATVKPLSHERVHFAQIENGKFVLLLGSNEITWNVWDNDDNYVSVPTLDRALARLMLEFEIRGQIKDRPSLQLYKADIVYDSSKSYSSVSRSEPPDIQTSLRIENVEKI